MKIFFIRHGETTGDVENRYGGDYNDHLTEKGKEQSAILAEQLKDKNIDVIFSSSLIRAQETSKFISEKIGCEIIIEPSLKERNQYGILTGMEKEEAKERYSELVELLKDKYNTIEGAETCENFSARITEVFHKITNDSQYDCIAIVSHGGPLRILFRDILKWGELKNPVGDCAFVQLEKNGEAFSWVSAEGVEPLFPISTP